MDTEIKAVLLDFGGVVADEGFRDGLRAIAKDNGLDPDAFYAAADRIIYETGYLTGNADEASFWKALHGQTGIAGSDQELREEILKRFIIRPDMLAVADGLRSRGLVVAVLSDQTNWLDEVGRATSFDAHFDAVFNSYHIHQSKREPSVFGSVCAALTVRPGEALFVDDNISHIDRAAHAGLRVIHFIDVGSFKRELGRLLTIEG